MSQVALSKDVGTTVYAENGYQRSVANLSQLGLATDNVFADDGADLPRLEAMTSHDDSRRPRPVLSAAGDEPHLSHPLGNHA